MTIIYKSVEQISRTVGRPVNRENPSALQTQSVDQSVELNYDLPFGRPSSNHMGLCTTCACRSTARSTGSAFGQPVGRPQAAQK